MRKIIFILFLLVLSAVIVQARTSIPNLFFGEVTNSENPAQSLIGQDISASIEGNGLGVIGEVQSGNSYRVLVDSEGRTGTITFYIGGAEANPTAEFSMGDNTSLDLTISEEPAGTFCGNGIREAGEQCDGNDLNFATCENVAGQDWTGTISCDASCSFDISACIPPECGDGTCNGNEDCSTCPADCGICCTEDWTCTDWSTCSGGTQTRECTNDNNCGTELNKPAESQSCTADNGNTGNGGGGGGGGGSGGGGRRTTTQTPQETEPKTPEPELTAELPTITAPQEPKEENAEEEEEGDEIVVSPIGFEAGQEGKAGAAALGNMITGAAVGLFKDESGNYSARSFVFLAGSIIILGLLAHLVKINISKKRRQRRRK